jgi:hypothetical protein
LIAVGSLLVVVALSVLVGLYGLHWQRQQQLVVLQRALHTHATKVQRQHTETAYMHSAWLYKQAAMAAWHRERQQSKVPLTYLLWVQQVASNIDAQVKLVQLEQQGLTAQLTVAKGWDYLQSGQWLPAGGRLLGVAQVGLEEGKKVWQIEVGLSL